jgi:3-hydroxymyristoyl/3-hydroxydecanoyl-(acyl carrier protein) dehydratase
MLEGFLYKVVEKGDGSAQVELLPDCPIYAAHFPGFPVTPGVTLVQMALELMDKKLQSAKDIKFVVPVLPSKEGTVLKYEWTVAEDRADVTVFLSDGTLCAKMALGV